MSFLRSMRHQQQATNTAGADHPVNNHPNLPDFFRLRQVEKILQHTNLEIEQLKERISRLEGLLASRDEPVHTVNENAELFVEGKASTIPLLPITELKEIAAMAKRFK